MKNSLRKLMAIFMVVMLLAANVSAMAEAAGTLILPGFLKVVEEEAFMGDTSISHVVVPEGATAIGPRAFAGSSVSSIVLPSTLKYIGSYAFNRTGIRSITLPDSLTYIGEGVFEKCNSLVSLTIPVNVEGIDSNPVLDCASLTTISVAGGNANYKAVDGVLYSYDGSRIVAVPAAKTGNFDIPASVTVIGSCAFCGCESLDRINIPVEVNEFEWNVFTDCSADIYAHPNSYAAQWLRENSIPFKYFDSAAGDFTYSVNDDETVAITGYTGNGSVVVIPATLDGMAVTAIGDNAFNGNSIITSIIIPEGVKTIGAGAFANCANQLLLSFPVSVISMDESAIAGGAGVGITAVADSFIAQWCNENGFYYTQAGIENLDYTIDEYGNITINDYNGSDRVFAVPAVIKGSPVVAIAESAFDESFYLTEVYIPASVTSIGAYAFSSCDKLSAINVDADNTVYASDDGVVYSKDMKLLHICPPGKRGAVTVPAGVTTIMERAFYGCESVTGIVLPEGLVAIGMRAFDGIGITSIDIPDTVVAIGDSAFSSCYKLESVELSASLDRIGDTAFYSCENLTSVTIPESSPISATAAPSKAATLWLCCIPRRAPTPSSSSPKTCRM